MNVSGLSPSSSAYASTLNRSTGSGAARTDGKSEKANSGELSPEDAAQVAKLKQIDRQVRQHEQAHLSAAGGMATSGASFTYKKGPDGVNYAVGGEVSISTSPGRTPEETIQRARTIRAAALAPADPSGQDRAVAAQAAKMEMEARMELAQQSQDNAPEAGNEDTRRQSKLDRFYGASSGSAGQAVSAYA